jgi:hypothetical protein
LFKTTNEEFDISLQVSAGSYSILADIFKEFYNAWKCELGYMYMEVLKHLNRRFVTELHDP